MHDGPSSLTVHGLDDVLFADTALSDVDGVRGALVIAGRDVERASERTQIEDFAASLLGGDRSALAYELGLARVEAHRELARLEPALALPDGMAALRAALSMLDGRYEDPRWLCAAVGVFAAEWMRRIAKAPRLEPDRTRGHAEDLLRLALGRDVAPSLAQALDRYLCTVSDHGMNASTFTARVVASTQAGLRASVVAALAALEGPLHGGAPGPVLDMLDAIGDPSRAVAWLEAELAAGRRIMGMGHRIYRVRDPRAAVFERALEHLATNGVHTPRLALARAVERAAEGVLRQRHPSRPLHANVEFYTAVLLDTLGLAREGFTLVFAAGRVFGWCAHVAEQRAHGRLVRPASRYVGPAPA